MPLISCKEWNMKAVHTKQTKERYWKRNICYWWALFLSSYTKNLSAIVTLHNYKPARLNDIRYVHTSHYDICYMNVKYDMLMYEAQTVLAQHEVPLIDWLIDIKHISTQKQNHVYYIFWKSEKIHYSYSRDTMS